MNIFYTVNLSLILLALPISTIAQRPGPTGSGGGNHGGITTQWNRTTSGNQAHSDFAVTGRQGQGVSGNAASSVVGNQASGQAHIETTTGRSADLDGNAAINGNSLSGSGSITTSGGHSATASGSVTKTTSGVQSQADITTGSGKSYQVEQEGNLDSGAITVTGEQASKSYNYDRTHRPWRP